MGSIKVEWEHNSLWFKYDINDTVLDFLKKMNELTDINLMDGILMINNGSNILNREALFLVPVESLGISHLKYRYRIGGPPRLCNWKDYIFSSSLCQFQKYVSWRPTITIILKRPHIFATKYYTIDCKKIIKSHTNDNYQNLWHSYINENFLFTTQSTKSQRVVLIELRDEINENNIDALRYNVFGCNNSYYGGERDSWQRYTRKNLIDISISCTADDLISVTPSKILTPNKWHALVLLNTRCEGTAGIFDDHLIPFLTNSCEDCKKVIYSLLMAVKRSNNGNIKEIMRIICRYYIWPTRFYLFSFLNFEELFI